MFLKPVIAKTTHYKKDIYTLPGFMCKFSNFVAKTSPD